uniref:RING-type E3 ubiquitin transferase n=1 Tax=Anthurium amnicola TaxID=1678845 RepID=A0A1D1XDG4_9ARAE
MSSAAGATTGVDASAVAAGTPYWCYRCSRFVGVWGRDAIVCPDCETGFVERFETPPGRGGPRRRPFPAAAVSILNPSGAGAGVSRPNHLPDVLLHRSRRAAAGAGDRPPFNPIIVLRRALDGGVVAGADADMPGGTFELYYDDGVGSGLRPLPASVSDFLMGSGFDRLLEQLAQLEINGIGGRGCEHPPASKAAVESMPTVEIAEAHVGSDAHCAVCKEPFEMGAEAREMPCKHIYHQDCIFPWLSLRNSCPVCRHEMPTDMRSGRGAPEPDAGEQAAVGGSEEDAVGLTIWRLPGGGFAVGRFSGGRAAGERELPVVYTEMDGGFNTGGAPRRISWTSRGSRSRSSGGIGRAFLNFFSLFGRLRGSSSSSSRSSSSRRNRSGSAFDRLSGGRDHTSASEDTNATGMSRW